MDEIVNPYIAGAPVTEQRMFFGREDIFQWIENSITGQYADHILVIHGQRRVGKTSVLKQLGNRLPKRFIPVFFDLQGRTHTTLDRFLWWLAREIVRVLKQECGIEIPLPEKEAFSADLEYFENQFLPGLHSSLAGNTLLLTFDEFDNLEESEIKETLGRPLIDYLRRMMSNKDLNFIFSIGSSGRKLENMQASYTDFFKTALYKKISFLNEEQTHKLITQPVDGIIEYDKPATNRIFRITGGHPYFTQLTCHELFARCQRTDQRCIREADVEAILDDVVERGTVNLKFVWDEASDIEKWALASLALLDKPDSRTLSAYLHKQNVRFSESDLTSGLLHLREKDILTPQNRFVIQLLRLWLQKNRPIEQVREELTEVNPIANRYIEIGLEFKNNRQYEKAIESFQQALTISAGNIQAQVSIALVYMDQKAFDKAVGEFEKALAIDDEDVTARSGLCEAHLALGDTATQKGRWKEAAQSYQRVLGINEEHSEARQRMAEIHRQRAEKSLVEGRDEEALNAFADAMKYAPDDETLSARVEVIRAEKKARVIATQIARSEKEASVKNWEAAIRTLEEAKSLAPDDSNIQKRLADVREKLRESKLAVLRTKAQSAVKAAKFGEALKTWQEYLSLEPHDREKAEEEISRLKKLVELEEVYNEAQQAITDKGYDKAINLLKQVIVQDENFKDTSRLLTQAIELRRSSRPARITLPVAKILKGLLIIIGIAGLGISAYFAWSQWGKNLASSVAVTPKITSVTAPSTQVAMPTLDPAIQIALDTIKNEAPFYQTNFDTMDFEGNAVNAKLESGKLIVSSVNDAHASMDMSTLRSEKFAVEFDVRVLDSGPGHCIFETVNEYGFGDPSYRAISAMFFSNGQTILGHYVHPDQFADLVTGKGDFDFSKPNTITLIFLGNEITAFVNGQIAYTVLDPAGSAVYTSQALSANYTIGCEFDNFKIWDLRNEITVTSAEDSGPGTLRKALLGAQAGDVIRFDTNVFPPDKPTTIYTLSELPRISQGDVMIDASNAGVILDGSKRPEGFGLILSSDRNAIMGLQIINFPGSAVYFEGGSFNLFGGNRRVGKGPIGQGNLISNNYVGIDLLPNAEGNTITGNLIGTDVSGGPLGNWKAGILWDSDNIPIAKTPNIVGPDNIIAYNGALNKAGGEKYVGGIEITKLLQPVTITANSIYDNAGPGIYHIEAGADTTFPQPVIIYFDLASGTVNGSTCKNCVVEIFSTETQDGKIYEGKVTADEFGNFAFSKGGALSGPFLTATTTPPGGNTSEFSQPTSTRSAIQIALDTIKNEAPYYQTSFDTWEFGDPVENVKVENGKLIVTSVNQAHVPVDLSNVRSDRFAVEFEFRFSDADPDNGRCILELYGDGGSHTPVVFLANSYMVIAHEDSDHQPIEDLAKSWYDTTKINTVTLILLGNQIATFVNGQLANLALDPTGSAVYSDQELAAQLGITCEFDNYKIWDLSGVDFNP